MTLIVKFATYGLFILIAILVLEKFGKSKKESKDREVESSFGGEIRNDFSFPTHLFNQTSTSSKREGLERESDFLRSTGASPAFVDAVDDQLGRTQSERDYEDNRMGYHRPDDDDEYDLFHHHHHHHHEHCHEENEDEDDPDYE